MESVIIEHHGHSGMQILNKRICNIYVTDRIATYLFVASVLHNITQKKHDKAIQWHTSSNIKPDIENIQGNSPQGQTSPFTWTDIFRRYCAQQNKQMDF